MKKSDIEEEIRHEYSKDIEDINDEESLISWSTRAYRQLKEKEKEFNMTKEELCILEKEKREARIRVRKCVGETQEELEGLAEAWHARVQAYKECGERVKRARVERQRLQALSAILAEEVRKRRERKDSRKQNGNVKGSRRRLDDIMEKEPCPFCNHVYTVRDGTLPSLNGMGEPLQMRKCQCREMAPPCKNCPRCSTNDALMSIDTTEEQLQKCKEEENCDICSCQCPGGGKWIEGDELSRQKFRKKAATRYEKLTGVLKTSWDGHESSHQAEGCQHESSLADIKISVDELPKRLPADIQEQVIALTAAQELMFADNATGKDKSASCCVVCDVHEYKRLKTSL